MKLQNLCNDKKSKKELKCHQHSSLVQPFVGQVTPFSLESIYWICIKFCVNSVTTPFRHGDSTEEVLRINPHKLVSQRKHTKFNDSNYNTRAPQIWSCSSKNSSLSPGSQTFNFMGAELFLTIQDFPPLEKYRFIIIISNTYQHAYIYINIRKTYNI